MTRVNSFVHDACGWVARLAWLNVLLLAVTLAGFVVLGFLPATVAMYAVMRGWLTDPESRERSTARRFLTVARAEAVRANRAGYPVVLVGLLLSADLLIARAQPGVFGAVLFDVSVAVAALYVATVAHLPYIYVRQPQPLGRVVRTAWFYALSHPLGTAAVVATWVVMSFVTGHWPGLLVFFGGSVACAVTVALDEQGFLTAVRRGTLGKVAR